MNAALPWLALMLVLWLGTSYVSYHELARQASIELERLSSEVSIELEKYRSLPRVLATHPLLANTLNVSGPENVRRANLLLEQFNRDLGSDALYIIDAQGMTVASSNWQSPNSFIGEEYSFRPYFTQAIRGEAGSYFALGTRSKKRGYYFSYPVVRNGAALGILAIKVSLSVIEQSWQNADFHYLLTDNNGVIFYSSRDSWLYRALTPISEEIRETLIRQRQFGTSSIEPLLTGRTLQELERARRIFLPDERGMVGYVQRNRTMSHAGWKLFVLAPLSSLYPPILRAMLLASVIYLLLFLVYLYWRRTVVAKKELAKVNGELESRVEKRTKELRHTNERLIATIEKQKKTEMNLRQAQNELIQAAKLAMLGEMSASINHELNQPLSAIRTYSENAQRLLTKERYDAAMENLAEIVKLNEMMAKIISQLKTFSGKSDGQIEAVPLATSVHQAVAILQNQIFKGDVRLHVDKIDDALLVDAKAIPLTQVLINLLNNALYAVANNPSPKVGINVETRNGKARVTVWDNGIGFSPGQTQHLFEPFYTTKTQGLGLGLAISKRIVQSFNGDLTASDRLDDGAEFTVTLHCRSHENAS